MKYAKILRWPERPATVRKAHELAFLPAALEIVETPPSPIGRVIAITISALFAIAVVWSYFGHVDIVSTARGKIIPSERIKIIQPFETSVVHAIHVHDGQQVEAGQLLIELDPTMNKAEQEHLQSDLISAQLDIARLRAALAGSAKPENDFHPPNGASAELIEVQRHLLAEEAAEHRAKIAALDRQEAQKTAEGDTISGAIDKLNATIPIVQQIVDVRKILYSHETGSKLNYLDSLQTLVQQQHDLDIQQSHLREVKAAIAAIVENRAETEAEYRRKLSSDLVEAERKAAGLADDLVRAERRTKLQMLTAPVAGTVQQIAVHTVGGIVTPAQPLLVVVPLDSHLEANVMVPNRDIGFVHEGQKAEIKVDAFDFTRFGLLSGHVLNVSSDSISRPAPQGSSNNTADSIDQASDKSGPSNQDLIYEARVSLDRTSIQVGDKLAHLIPGMAVTVEIKTGSRTIMSYLLSPLVRYEQNSLRER